MFAHVIGDVLVTAVAPAGVLVAVVRPRSRPVVAAGRQPTVRGPVERHARDFTDRAGFTYSVLDADEVIGCLYIYPARTEGGDASARSW